MVGLLRHGWADAATISAATGIAPWFTERIAEVVAAERRWSALPLDEAKRQGFGDAEVAAVSGVPAAAVRRGCGPAWRRPTAGWTPAPASSRRDAVLLLVLRRRRRCRRPPTGAR